MLTSHDPPAMRPVSSTPERVDVPLQQPDTASGLLGPYAVPYDRLIGRWCVVASTLPLCASPLSSSPSSPSSSRRTHRSIARAPP